MPDRRHSVIDGADRFLGRTLLLRAPAEPSAPAGSERMARGH
jgi:hypothetical protein